jgi:hypothetical protein
LKSNSSRPTVSAWAGVARLGEEELTRPSSQAGGGRYGGPVSNLDEVGERDGWRCWVCDETVDPQASVNNDRGPSIDSRTSKPAKKRAADVAGGERLAHRACNTRKGAVTAVIPWPADLLIIDPAPLLGVAERLDRKGGREIVARCPDRRDADKTADWLVDRFARLAPALPVESSVDPGGGQFLVALTTARRR